MKKITTLTLAILFLAVKSNSQITKGNWLVGGNMSFISDETKYLSAGTGKMLYLQVTPNIGYFITDKFAAGLKLSVENNKYILNLNTTSSTSYAFGPFVRYYFLPTENQLNLFVEGGYKYGISKPSNQSGSSFSIITGPVFYFNSSVGLEFTIGYSTTKSSETTSNNKIQFGLGFQIHLERDK